MGRRHLTRIDAENRRRGEWNSVTSRYHTSYSRRNRTLDGHIARKVIFGEFKSEAHISYCGPSIILDDILRDQINSVDNFGIHAGASALPGAIVKLIVNTTDGMQGYS